MLGRLAQREQQATDTRVPRANALLASALTALVLAKRARAGNP